MGFFKNIRSLWKLPRSVNLLSDRLTLIEEQYSTSNAELHKLTGLYRDAVQQIANLQTGIQTAANSEAILLQRLEAIDQRIQEVTKALATKKTQDRELKFYGQFDPPVDKFIYERYFRNTQRSRIAVECGAFDGLTECSCKFFEETQGWKVINIEPMPAAYSRLCSNRPNSRNLNFALSSSDDTAIFKEVRHPTLGTNFGNSSLGHTQEHLKDLELRGCSFEDIRVTTKTWRSFVEEERLAYVDLFVLDVEGHELSVIEGMIGCPVLPDLVCVEIGHLDFDLVRTAFHKLGYIYDASSHVNAFFIHETKLPLFSLRAGSD